MKRIGKRCSLLAFNFLAVITGRVDAMIRSLVYDHCNFRFLAIETYLLSAKIPNGGGLTRFALDFDLLKDRNQTPRSFWV